MAIVVENHDMSHMHMIATDADTNRHMVSLRLDVPQYSFKDAVDLARRYVKRGCNVEIFTPKEMDICDT